MAMEALYMNKTILAIRGKADQGKSKTICKVIERVEKLPGVDIRKPVSNVKSASDKCIIADYPSKGGNIRIGITSEGDPNSSLDALLTEFVKEHCHIILCASRTSHETYKRVCRVHDEDGYDLIWLSNMHLEPKDTSDIGQIKFQQVRLNEASANYVFSVMIDLTDRE